MPRWFARTPEVPVRVIERVEPVEVPVLTEAKRRIARGETERALREAYAAVVADLQRAYDVRFPDGWSAEEIVRRGLTEPMAPVADFFARLTALYVPRRYAAPAAPLDPDELLAILQSLYAAGPMWRLYLAPRAASGPESPAPADAAAPGGPA